MTLPICFNECIIQCPTFHFLVNIYFLFISKKYNIITPFQQFKIMFNYIKYELTFLENTYYEPSY